MAWLLGWPCLDLGRRCRPVVLRPNAQVVRAARLRARPKDDASVANAKVTRIVDGAGDGHLTSRFRIDYRAP